MSRPSVLLIVVATILTVGQSVQKAAGQDSGLKSVLISEDDLRPLVDLNTPSAEVIATPTSDASIAPIPDPKDAILPVQPVPEQPGPEQPGPEQPGPGQAVPVQPVPESSRGSATNTASQAPGSNANSNSSRNTNSNAPQAATRVVSPDPMFDIGVAAIPVRGGAQVRGVFVDSAAQRSGVRAGDTIVGIDGKRTPTAFLLTEQLANTLSRTDRFALNIQRRGRRLVLPIDTAGGKSAVPASPRSGLSNANEVIDPRSFVRDTLRRQIRALRISDSAAESGAPNLATSPNANTSPNNPDANRPTASGETIPTPTGQRPLNGGRIIGNGRLINSARRLIGY